MDSRTDTEFFFVSGVMCQVSGLRVYRAGWSQKAQAGLARRQSKNPSFAWLGLVQVFFYAEIDLGLEKQKFLSRAWLKLRGSECFKLKIGEGKKQQLAHFS